MTSWDSTKVPIYKLVQRPDDAWPPPQAPPRSRPSSPSWWSILPQRRP